MPEELEKLIGAAPDPGRDREALVELRDSGSPEVQKLAEHLLSDEEWCSSRLGQLLPGLSLIEAPNFLIRLNERAVNPILKAELGTLRALATKTPMEILDLPGIGKGLAEEILAITVSEWTTAYLGDEDRGSRASASQSADASEAPDPRERQRRLSDTFEKIEALAGFDAFRCRKLDPGKTPSQSEAAAALGLKPEQVARYEKVIAQKLAQRMQDEDTRLAEAVSVLKDAIGVLARPQDLESALETVDPLKRAMPKDAPQRRALLLLLAGLRESDGWVVDVDIEEIVDALLKGLTESGPADLDVLDRQLDRLGMRADLRLPWTASRPGYRMIRGQLVRSDGS